MGKKQYEAPTAEIVRFDYKDMITACSGVNPKPSRPDCGWDWDWCWWHEHGWGGHQPNKPWK
jgi:hypothetical protein